MATGKAALYDKALKFMQKGQWDRALDFMMQAHTCDGSDPHITMKIGDLNNKLGRPRDAAGYYMKTADIFAAQGHTTKAAATYKMILRLDPSLTEVQDKLDEMTAASAAAGPMSFRPAASSTNPSGQPAVTDAITQTAGQDDTDDTGFVIQHGSSHSGADDMPTPAAAVDTNTGDFGEFLIERPGRKDEPSPGFEPDPELDEGLVGGTTFGIDVSGTGPAPSTNMFGDFAADVDAPADGSPQIDLESASKPKDVEFLTDLEEEELWELLGKMDRLTFGPGEDIVREGDTGDSIYIISEGRVSVSTAVGGNVVVLAELGEQDFFGEVSFLTGRPRTATVTALETTHVMELKRSEVNDLISRYPNVEKVLKMFHQNRVADTISTMNTVTKGLF